MGFEPETSDSKSQYPNRQASNTPQQIEVVLPREVLQGTRLSLNGLSHHRFSQDSLVFSAILRVNSIGHSMAKTIVTI